METKILFNTLKSIGTGKEFDIAPDKEYLKSLESIGLITLEWNNKITPLGIKIRDFLNNELNKF